MDAPLMRLRSTRILSRAPCHVRCLSTQARWQTPLGHCTARPKTPSPIARESIQPAIPRGFFSLADVARLLPNPATPGGGSDVAVQEFHARKILPYTQEQLYTIVADIPSYSSFIPFCTSSRITSSSSSPSAIPTSASPSSPSPPSNPPFTPKPFDAQASLSIGFASFSEKFTSRVEGIPYEEVKATAVDSPLFKGLKTTWRFAPASPTSPHSTATPTGLPSPAAPPASAPTLPSSANIVIPATSSSRSPSISSGPTLLTIDLTFSFVNPLHQIASQAFLPKLEELMVGAFEKRCLEVYGRGKM